MVIVRLGPSDIGLVDGGRVIAAMIGSFYPALFSV